MNRLGFYVENTTVQYLRDALRTVQPPTMLLHAGDRGLLREIRGGLSPDTFIVGRVFVDQAQQTDWLSSSDPAAKGRAFAEQIINYDFGLATERGANGRLLFDAWMSLNEAVRGPASFPDGKPDAETRQRLEALDKFQEAFYQRLKAEGLEAVAFNFGAGNFTQAGHYLDFFPRSLAAYKYLGFHEYGWPTLEPAAATSTSALLYRQCMPDIHKKYNNRHQIIITEAGLARMYRYPNDPAGDVGWQYPGEPIPEGKYWTSLQWYNAEMLRDSYVLGCCLFSYGPTGRWETFRHLGVNTQMQPILITDKIATLNAAKPPPPPPPPPPDQADFRKRIAQVQSDLDLIILQCDAVLRQLAALDAALKGLADAMVVAPNPDEVQSLIRRIQTIQTNLQLLAKAGAAGLDIPALQAQAARLLAQAQALLAPSQQAVQLQQGIAQAQATLQTLTAQTQAVTDLKTRSQVLRAEADRLEALLGATPPAGTPGAPPQPALQDKRTTLPTHPTATYPTRAMSDIKRIVVHHTVTRDDVTPERLAQAQVDQGKPGITYHFLVNGDGTITWTQPLTAVVAQTLVDAVNVDSVAVALAGNFQNAVPTQPQMDSAAALIAWLIGSLGLDPAAVYGRSELDKRVGSPGLQWQQGARYKDTLMSQVNAILAGK